MDNRQNKNKGRAFWNNEYKKGGHLKLSEEPSEDLVKFTGWLIREHGREFLNPIASIADLGCGNGRNLIYLSKTFAVRGTGFDISEEAISQAKKLSVDLPLTYRTHTISDPLPLPDNSQTLVLDMMTSHFLNESERKSMQSEVVRVLKPNGWLFWKTFLLDEDSHAKRLLNENPAEEMGSYIHPKIGVSEHVFTEAEITESLAENFIVHKITKSHRHRIGGAAGKRRSISVYAQKK